MAFYRSRFVSAFVSVSFLAAPVFADDVFDAWGFNKNREYFSQFPFEHIDPMTGNVILTFTDLVLPGNAGFELKIQRTYNSKIYRDYDRLGETLGEDSWVGIGWTLLVARVLSPDGPGPPIVEMPDGSRHPAYRQRDNPGAFMTRDYWVYRDGEPAPVLRLTNGVTYTFGHRANITGLGTVLYATLVEDSFGNEVRIDYPQAPGAPPDAIERITQSLGDDQTREILFSFDLGRQKSLQSMILRVANQTYNWSFRHQEIPDSGHTLLTEVQPPEGPSWNYDYFLSDRLFSRRYELHTLTTPSRGTIEYAHGDQVFEVLGGPRFRSRVVTARMTSGPRVEGGTWRFAYSQGPDGNESAIASPCGTTTYTYSAPGGPWQVGVMTTKLVGDDSGVLEEERFEWRPSEPISFDTETVGAITATAIYVPLVGSRTVSRSGAHYETHNRYRASDFNDFGRPFEIVELGDRDRTTTREFQYGFFPYIVDKVARETVTTLGESFTKYYEYDPRNGFLIAESVYGITTFYEQDPFGNIRARIDGNGNRTRHVYFWGMEASIETPEYSTFRDINPEGTVRAVYRGRRQTRFEYDGLFRVTLEETFPESPVFIAYDNASGAFRREERGRSAITTSLDGFGRPTGTLNSVGVETEIRYDPCGRRVFESKPFTPGQNLTGTSYEYDGLDRLRRRATPDGTREYRYFGMDVEITDEEGRVTRQHWIAFGDPQEARLESVFNEALGETGYVYDALGNLTVVQSNGGPLRIWTYNERNQLDREFQPESGWVFYRYDDAGNLIERTDDVSGTSFEYDRSNRLRAIDHRDSFEYDTFLDYDESNNISSVRNAHVASTFIYDDANRLIERRDQFRRQSFFAHYNWDPNGNVSDVFIPGPASASIHYDYGPENRLALVRDGEGQILASEFDYHPSGAVASSQSGDHSFFRSTLDERDLIEDWGVFGGPTGTLFSSRYSYDGVGNVASIEDAPSGTTQTYSYDAANRVTHSGGSRGREEYDYDPLGNRVRKLLGGETLYSYSPETNRLESASGAEEDVFTYDAVGNLIATRTARFTYTPNNQVETATVGNDTTTYRYDGANLRKLKVTGDKNHYFIHGPAKELLAEFEDCGGGEARFVRAHVYAGRRLLAFIESETKVGLEPFPSSVFEYNGFIPVAVILETSGSERIACPVSVSYETRAGSAEAGLDFQSVSGTLTFPPGSGSGSSVFVEVPILDDELDEPDESFQLVLAGAQGATLGNATHTITIEDDDLGPVILVDDVSVVESSGAAVFTVSLSNPSFQEIRVSYSTEDGTANAGSDYESASGTLSFEPGATQKAVAVPVKDDTVDEPDERFALILFDPVNGLPGRFRAEATIVDDDEPVSVSIGDTGVLEGDLGTVEALFEVSLSRPSGERVVVSYQTRDGTAVAGGDFQPGGDVLVFEPGELVRRLSFAVFGDTLTEGNESFFVDLHEIAGASVGDGAGEAVIFDDDSGCGYDVSPRIRTFGAPGGLGTVEVSAAFECPWQAVHRNPWITLRSPATGNGEGQVHYGVSPNDGARSRLGTILVQGAPVAIVQSGLEPDPAPISIFPSGATYTARPDFVWSPVVGASEYRVRLEGSRGLLFDIPYLAGAVCGQDLCTLISPAKLGLGEYEWSVVATPGTGDGASEKLGFDTRLPHRPTGVRPAGSIDTRRPTYVWSAARGAEEYQIWVNGPSGAVVIQEWHDARTACRGGTCSATPATDVSGANEWWVQSKNSVGLGPWSSSLRFTEGQPPEVATLVSPSGPGISQTPVFVWNRVPNGTEYYLWVEGPAGVVVQELISATICGASQCSKTSPHALSAGAYRWWIQARNLSGAAPWSSRLDFTVGALPGRARMLAPMGPIPATQPTYVWTEIPDTTEYQLFVNGPPGNVFATSYRAKDVCVDGRCSVAPPVTLGPGRHSVWVQTKNASGAGPWSDGVDFTVTPQ